MNNLKDLAYIVVLFDTSAPSFCYYENKAPGTARPQQISLADFQNIVRYTRDNGYQLTLLTGEQELETPYLEALEGVDYATLKPVSKIYTDAESVCIIEYEGDDSVFKELKPGSDYNIILRLKSDYLSDLLYIIKKYSSCFKRLNLFITDIDAFPEDKLQEYGNILSAIEEVIFEYFLVGKSIELNFLTDRILLNDMNNCDAGVKHITLAPNGKFYLCPAFYYANEADSVGSPQTGIEIKNHQLLRLENAPICNICDAFHCKRCIFLNRKTTLELNTPSKIQCTLSHMERNTSKRLTDRLRKMQQFPDFKAIKEIDYLDPYELIRVNPELKRGWQYDDNKDLNNPENLTDRELLMKIHKMQIDILQHLNKTER
jgi:CXXX repeat peptide maturase